MTTTQKAEAMSSTTTAQFFTSSTTRALLRRQGGTDRVFAHGVWQPTDTIADYMIGEDDNVTPITEAQARKLEPAAFS